MLPIWWCLSRHTPFPGRFDPFFLCPHSPLLNLWSQQPKDPLPFFVSLVLLPLSGLWGRDWIFISLPYQPLSWYLNILNKWLKKIFSFNISPCSYSPSQIGVRNGREALKGKEILTNLINWRKYKLQLCLILPFSYLGS